MDQNFRKRMQKTLYGGELEPDHCPLALTEMTVEYFQDLAPHRLDFVDLESASLITRQDTVSPSSVAMGMIYAKRLQRKRPDYVTRMSSSDLFIISMMMASKYLYDEGVDEEVFNDEWAENANLEKDEINTMEMDFLDALDWELFIKKEDFDKAMLSIEKRIALRKGLERGWFSYTDLSLLLDDTWLQLLGSDMGLEWLQVVVVSSAAYVAGIMTMVGSTVLVTSAAAVGLGSSGLLLPALLPTSVTGPTALPSSPLALCAHPLAGCPPPLSASDLTPNETGQMEEGEEKKQDPQSAHQAWMPGQTVVDTILSQLMAVLTLKSHLAQFVYAVSDSYGSSRNGSDRNHSAGNSPSRYSHDRCSETQGDLKGDDQETPSAEDIMSRLDCFAAGSCSNCGLLEAEPVFPSALLTPSRMHCCCGGKSLEGWKGGWEWKGGPEEKHCHEVCPLYCCRAGAQSAMVCRDQAMATTHSLFPDIIIGFSTSMPPPVFAA